MKSRFNTYDIVCAVTELQKLIGQRVNQIYDIDNKTYLIRLGGGDDKVVLLIESGIRFHTTSFEWPKNMTPSGFSMKLRKHLKNKRLEKLEQLGADRIVDFQFGTGDAAYHVILELYDRGNIILTDHTLTILYILRPHHEGEDVRFAVREMYPTNRAKEPTPPPNEETMKELLASAKDDNLRRPLMAVLDCGPAVIEHVLCKRKLDKVLLIPQKKDETQEEASQSNEGKKSRKSKKQKSDTNTRSFDMEQDFSVLMDAIREAVEILDAARNTPSKGYIIKKEEETAYKEGAAKEYFYQNIEYHPYLFSQFEGQPVTVLDTFLLAVDEFYSALQGQKIDMRTLQQEREALKKLSNVKNDHAKRLEALSIAQEVDKQKAELISSNQKLVDNAILAVRCAIANQMSWPDIHELVRAAQANNDPVASAIKQLKLEINHISLNLADPYACADSSDDDYNEGESNNNKVSKKICTQVVDVDLALSAWANARKYYDQKRNAAQKEQKTIDASQKALKSAERTTKQTLKDVRTISTITKARKVYWFEKFYWFISSENYLVIGGRDAQQNELIVKRYMRNTDIYVHAEIQGASSVVIRNPRGGEVPPKTLLEAGTMAISYSVAWDAKVVTNAYWVYSEQVSKTAPTGEYLTTGSFIIRGKKNFLPSCHLIMGLSLLFKLEESFVEKHRDERKVRTFEEGQDVLSMERLMIEASIEDDAGAAEDCLDIEIDLDDEQEKKLNTINEETAQEGKENSIDNEELKGDTANELDVETNFPDTQVKIEHDTGRVTIGAAALTHETVVDKGNTELLVKADATLASCEATIIPAAPSRKKQQQSYKKRKEDKRKAQNQQEKQQMQQQSQKNSAEMQAQTSNSQMKRGQKGKLKKIRAKYKDQDEEERELRMQILKSSGKEKIGPSDSKLNEMSDGAYDKNKPNRTFKKDLEKQQQQADVDDMGDDMPAGADVEMLDSLTGQPFDDDELLFLIPVVAPYQALQNYKFKVKLTPGTGKRGRAAKTALTMFSKEKGCGLREKDLLKSIKEEALARNIPGKVKLSAPQLQKFKK